MSLNVLIVDDQRSPRRSLALLLDNAGLRADEAASGTEALQKLERTRYDVLVTDLRMDGMSGNQLLREVKTRYPQLPVILMTAYGSIDTAVEAMRLGAYDYLTKPFGEAEILEKITQAHGLAHASPSPDASASFGDLIAASAMMQGVLIRAERIARTDLSILIGGETGTGKSRLARYIHERSLRAAGPFISLNCASVPEHLLESELFGHAKGSFTGAVDSRQGLFEAADGGTMFLDEIDTLSPSMQAKLLSVLQEREIRRVGSNQRRKVDIRVIAAANRDLTALIDSGEFRPDLFYRVNGYRIQLPPLRERGEDLEILLERFLAQYADKYGRGRLVLTAQARAQVLAYGFPGNVRQLENLTEQMAVFADPHGFIDVDSLPEELLDAAAPRTDSGVARPPSLNLAQSERQVIEAALERYDNLTEVARSLGIGRTTLWRKLRLYDIRRGPRDADKQSH